MNIIKPPSIVRLFAAMVIAVATIGLSSLSMHAPKQTQNPVTLKSIQTDKTATFYANRGPDCAWFVEAVLPTGDSNVMTENLNSVAAAL